ncbi:Conserved_hypothetical protein [Hexamita inflata]|uniref:Uncharacterized protein n=1 Tax=Hexamita inflata TaxID=28002 RepID=A0AA86PYQ3_9EUKA|nr:Conserved hypothetical protein [Hexamita inflata]
MIILQIVMNNNLKYSSLCQLNGEYYNNGCYCPTNYTKNGSDTYYSCSCEKRLANKACADQCPINQGCNIPPCICSICAYPYVQDVLMQKCVTCAQINNLSHISGTTCICGSGTDGTFPDCVCKSNFINNNGQCTCQAIFQSSDNQTCVNQCNYNEIYIIISELKYCVICTNNLFPNIYKTICVNNCDNWLLSQEGTYCVQSCTNGYPNNDRQCQQCSEFSQLGYLNSFTGICTCASTSDQQYSFPNCQCLPDYIIQNFRCICPLLISVNGSQCISECPLNQFVDNETKQCSICEQNLVPNQAQTRCVSKTCESEYLSIDGNYCITSCLSQEAVPNDARKCVYCAYHISVDGMSCLSSCPLEQLSNMKQCQTCSPNTVPNLSKTTCVSLQLCSPGFLNIEQSFCVSSCSTEYGYPDENNKCLQCNDRIKLAEWGLSSCQCISGLGVTGSFPNCVCGSTFIQQESVCVCSQKISLDGSQCISECPASQVCFEMTVQCSSCPIGTYPNKDQTDCVSTTCYQSIFRHGMNLVFCYRGSQSNKIMNNFIAFQSDISFNGSLFLFANILTQVRIEGHVQNSLNMNFYSLNSLSCLKLIQSSVNMSISAICSSGLQAFGQIRIRYSQITFTVKYSKFSLAYQLRQLSEEEYTFFIEKLQISVKLIPRTQQGYFSSVDSNLLQDIYISNLMFQIDATSSQSIIGVCNQSNLTIITHSLFNYSIGSVLFTGLALNINYLTVQLIDFTFDVLSESAFGLAQTVNSCDLNNIKLVGLINSQEVVGIVKYCDTLKIYDLKFGLVTQGTVSCGFVHSVNHWNIQVLQYLFQRQPLQPAFGDDCSCADWQEQINGLCYERT